jgi:hypothetical protein
VRRIRQPVQGFRPVFRSSRQSFREALEHAAVIEALTGAGYFDFELAQRTLKCACR